MVFSTPCSRNASAPWRRALGALLFAIGAVAMSVPAVAEGITPVRAKVEAGDDGYRLDAEFDIRFSPGLEEAVNRGVALYFVVEFELTKPRWY